MGRKSETDLAKILAGYVAMTRDQLRAEWFETQTLASSDASYSPHAGRTLALIDAIGEFRFPGKWNEWDSVVA